MNKSEVNRFKKLYECHQWYTFYLKYTYLIEATSILTHRVTKFIP